MNLDEAQERLEQMTPEERAEWVRSMSLGAREAEAQVQSFAAVMQALGQRALR